MNIYKHLWYEASATGMFVAVLLADVRQEPSRWALENSPCWTCDFPAKEFIVSSISTSSSSSSSSSFSSSYDCIYLTSMYCINLLSINIWPLLAQQPTPCQGSAPHISGTATWPIPGHLWPWLAPNGTSYIRIEIEFDHMDKTWNPLKSTKCAFFN